MRILAFTPFSSMRGGANRSFIMVLKNLKNKYNHSIFVIVPELGELTDELDKLNIPWKLVKSKKIRGVYGVSPKNFLRICRLFLYTIYDDFASRKIVKEFKGKFDIVYLNDCDTNIGAFSAIRMKIPYVWHFRSLIKPDFIIPFNAKKQYKKCNKIIAISEGMKKLLDEDKTIPKGIIEIVYNGLPIIKCEKAKSYFGGEMHFVLCGRLSEDKGHKDALHALKILKDEGITDIVLHIAGCTKTEYEEEYKKSLIKYAEDNGFFDRVIFEGQIDDMPSFREKMNGELVCSVCEPFGRVTVEGMRSGLVVIGSNTGGTPEIINDNVTGLLYEQGNGEDLAEKIKQVYENPEFARKLADTAYDFGNTHFLESDNVEKVNAILYKEKNYYEYIN